MSFNFSDGSSPEVETGRGRMGGPLAGGPGGYCICPECKRTFEHVTGHPCVQQKCPDCGVALQRRMGVSPAGKE